MLNFVGYFISIITVALILINKQCDGLETIELSVKQGDLSGLLETTFLKKQSYYAFRSIPYAKPPKEKLRFLPPLPHNGWTGVYEAHETKPTCVQFNARMRNDESYGLSGSEDCLYLSVYTPKLVGSFPVIVFDYHDYFKTSFNGTKTYSPDFFIEEDIIVVTISHRLGIFGYLSTEDDVVPGNAGLKDYILGLQWIQDNIQKFGGDPDKVTLMGSNGASAMVNVMLYTEKAKGLFGGAILQSGSIMEAKYFPKNTRQRAFDVGKYLNITADDSTTLLKELQNIDINSLISSEPHIIDMEEIRSQQVTVLPFSPTIEHDHEGAVIKSLPEEMLIINDVPIIIGFNSREGLDLSFHYLSQPMLYEHTIDNFFVHFPVRTNYRFDVESSIYKTALEEIKKFYFTNGEITINNLLEYTVFAGDMIQIYATNYAVRKLAKEAKSPVYYYVFDFKGALNENMEYISKRSRFSTNNRGATITDELCYLLFCSRIRRNYEEINELASEQREMKVLRRMLRLWGNFAKKRDPTPENDRVLNGVHWQSVNEKGVENKYPYLHISKKLEMKASPFAERMKFWDEFLNKYSSAAIDGVVTDRAGNREEL